MGIIVASADAVLPYASRGLKGFNAQSHAIWNGAGGAQTMLSFYAARF